jgi:hypothetical protein
VSRHRKSERTNLIARTRLAGVACIASAYSLPRLALRVPMRLARQFTKGLAQRDSVHSAGMATAEYAVATLAACGFAALLMALLRSDEVRGLLLSIVQRALAVG